MRDSMWSIEANKNFVPAFQEQRLLIETEVKSYNTSEEKLYDRECVLSIWPSLKGEGKVEAL